jgi:hypothetical protein
VRLAAQNDTFRRILAIRAASGEGPLATLSPTCEPGTKRQIWTTRCRVHQVEAEQQARARRVFDVSKPET